MTVVDSRAHAMRWLLRQYGVPMPAGPMQSVRPRSSVSRATTSVLGAMTMFLGGSIDNAAEIMRRAIARIDGPPANGGSYCRHSWLAFKSPGSPDGMELCGRCLATRVRSSTGGA